MLSIRLARGGAKKRPYYHVIVAEKSSARNGRFVERLGALNPVAAGQEKPLTFNMERYEHWRRQGAQPTDAVRRLARICRRAAGAAAAPSAS